MKSFLRVFKSKSGSIGFIRTKTHLDPKGAKLIELKASMRGNKVGESEVYIPSKNQKLATILEVYVNKGFRKQGISSALFKSAMSESKNRGARFLTSDAIISPYQVLIRSKYRTKFFKRTDSDYSFITKDNAIKELSKTKEVVRVAAITKIPDQKVVFKRIRGRIIPIRKKK